MRPFILIFSFLLSTYSLAGDPIYGPQLVPGQTEAFNTYRILNKAQGPEFEVVIEGQKTFGCFPAYEYEVTRGKGVIFVHKKPLVSISVLCDYPVQQNYKVKIQLTHSDRYSALYVPAGDHVRIDQDAQSLPPGKICTAQFAHMIHPETKECVNASNGCVIESLHKAGFKMASAGECE